MKTKLIYLILLIAVQFSYSQIEPEWVALYTGPETTIAAAIAVDNLGNVYVTGRGSSGITIKYNSNGVQQWVRTENTAFNRAIKVDGLGNVYVTGIRNFGSTLENDYVTIKYNTDGELQWLRIYNGPANRQDDANSIAVDNEGNVFVTGFSTYLLEGFPRSRYTTIKYSPNGDELWVKGYIGPTEEGAEATSIAVDKYGNAYVTGYDYNTTDYDYVTIKYSPNGNELWVRRYNNNLSDYSVALVVDTSGNVYVTGTSQSGAYQYDFATIKYNSDGIMQWTERWGLPGKSSGSLKIEVDNNGNVYVGGMTANDPHPNIVEYVTLKYNSEGILQWSAIYGDNRINSDYSIGVDKSGNVYVAGLSWGNTGSGLRPHFTVIKYDSVGVQQWVHKYLGQDYFSSSATALVVDELDNVYVTGSSYSEANSFDITTIKYPGIRYPVFIVPGIAGTYAADTENDLGWIMARGVAPDALQIDPLGKVYTDLITTFENLGYEQGKDLFVVNYDWRLLPAPIDNNIDGHINGLSGVSITNDQFNYGVDYLGWYIKQACERFRQDYGMELDSIDVIAHSTGGLVTRTYIQSNAYGDVYDISNNYKLPKIRNFVMIGVPNRGASKAWNAVNDNWIADKIYRFVLAKIVNSAYQKVLQNQTITGPDYNITKSDILDSLGNPSKTKFINKYVPTLRGLLATYEFIDFGNGYIDVNNNPDQRNTFVLDLNDGLDLYANADPNKFLDSTKLSVIYGTGRNTFNLVQQRSDHEYNAIHSFTDWTRTSVSNGTIWYKDIGETSNGDSTVPTISAVGQFINDSRANKLPFSSGDHTKLVSMVNVQSSILEILKISFSENNISTGSGADISNVLNVISDPVELIITDGNGNRLGFTNSTGSLTEIPGSVWFGNADGRGWVFGSVQEPINLQLTGLGEDYYVMVSVEDSGKYGGVVLEGFLDTGEVINYQITLDPLSVDQIKSLTPDYFDLAQNYPNPFNPVTTIQYSIQQRSNVTLKVYDVLGNEIAVLVSEEKDRGVYTVNFNAAGLASGIYLYRLQAGSFVETKKMILLK